MNKQIEELYNKLDAQDKIINTQALEIARLKERNQEIYDGFMVAIDEVCETDREKREYKQKIDKAIEYIKENKYVSADENCEILAGYRIDKLLEILGDKNE